MKMELHASEIIFFHRIPLSGEGKYSIGITIASKKLVTGKADCSL